MISQGDGILPRLPISHVRLEKLFCVYNILKIYGCIVSKLDFKPWHSNLQANIIVEHCKNNTLLAKRVK